MVELASRARTPSAAVARSWAIGASSFIANMLVRFARRGESLDPRPGTAFAVGAISPSPRGRDCDGHRPLFPTHRPETAHTSAVLGGFHMPQVNWLAVI